MRRQDKMPARNKKNFRSTKSGAGMTRAGVAAYRRKNLKFTPVHMLTHMLAKFVRVKLKILLD